MLRGIRRDSITLELGARPGTLPYLTSALPTMHTFMRVRPTKHMHPSRPTVRAGAMGIGGAPFARSATALQGSTATVLATAWTV